MKFFALKSVSKENSASVQHCHNCGIYSFFQKQKCMQEFTQIFWGNQDKLPFILHYVIQFWERERKIKLLCYESWFYFNRKFKSKSDVKALATCYKRFSHEFPSSKLPSIKGYGNSHIFIYMYVCMFSRAVSLNCTFPLLLCFSVVMHFL